MNERPPRHPMTLAPVCVRIPGMDTIEPEHLEFPGAAGARRTLDLYLPPERTTLDGAPVVVFVSGYPDPGMAATLGCEFREMQQIVDWARIAAASGMAAVCYANEEPVADLMGLLRWLSARADGVDLWACSGHGPLALHALSRPEGAALRCAVLCYGYTLDLDGGSTVARAAEQFGFVAPEPAPEQEPSNEPDRSALVPLVLVRSGRDEMPGLNDAMDRFIGHALRRGRPLEVHNLPDAPHAFDLHDDRPASHRAIRRIVEVLREHLVEPRGA